MNQLTRQLRRIEAKVSTGDCPTCHSHPQRVELDDGAIGVPVTGCPTCGQQPARIHQVSGVDVATFSRMTTPAVRSGQ